MTAVVFCAKRSLAPTSEANSLAALSNDTPLRPALCNLAKVLSFFIYFHLIFILILCLHHKLLVIRIRIKCILYLAELRI